MGAKQAESPINESLSEARGQGHPDARSLLPLYGVVFVGFVGYSLMIAVFTPMMLRGSAMLAGDTPLSQRTISLGLLLSMYPLGQFFGSPIMGAFSDRFGRKPILLTSLSVTMISYAFMAYALMIRSFQILSVACLIAGFAEANIVTAQSAIADVIPEDQRNRFFGYIYMSESSAYIVGPLVGGKLADPQLVPWFNNSTPFWAVLALLFLTLLSSWVVYKETRPPGLEVKVGYREAFSNLLGVVTNRRLRPIYWINFLIYLAIFGYFRSYPMYLVDEFHLGVSRVSEFIAWVGVPIILANLWLTGYASAHFSLKRLTAWTALMTGVFMAVIVIPSQPAALWITLFLTSTPLALCLPSSGTLLSMAASADDQGRVMGNNQALMVGAEALSCLVGGLVAGIAVKLSLIVFAIIAVIAALLVTWFVPAASRA